MLWPHTPLGALTRGLGLGHPLPAPAFGAELDAFQNGLPPSPLPGALGTRPGLSVGLWSIQTHRLEGKTHRQTDATGSSSALGPLIPWPTLPFPHPPPRSLLPLCSHHAAVNSRRTGPRLNARAHIDLAQRRVRVHVGPPSGKSYFGISRNSQRPETPQAGGTRQGWALFELGLLRPAHI